MDLLLGFLMNGCLFMIVYFYMFGLKKYISQRGEFGYIYLLSDLVLCGCLKACSSGNLSQKLSSQFLILQIISFLIYRILHILFMGYFLSFLVICRCFMVKFFISQWWSLSIRSIGVRAVASIN